MEQPMNDAATARILNALRLLIAETSCESRNEFLDRALVVPTVATPAAAFFVGGGG
jgi:hypothetical protein